MGRYTCLPLGTQPMAPRHLPTVTIPFGTTEEDRGREGRWKEQVTAGLVLPNLVAVPCCTTWMGGKGMVFNSRGIHRGPNLFTCINIKITGWYFLRSVRKYEGLFQGTSWKVSKTWVFWFQHVTDLNPKTSAYIQFLINYFKYLWN